MFLSKEEKFTRCTILFLEETILSTNPSSLHATPASSVDPLCNPSEDTIITGIDSYYLNF